MQYNIKTQIQKDIVPFHTRFVHIMPVTVSRRREKGFIMEYPGWGEVKKVVVKAFETLNIFDLTVLLALYKYIFDNFNQETIKKYKVINEEGEITEEFYKIFLPPYQFVKYYVGLNYANTGSVKKLVYESLDRFKLATWEFFFSDTEFSSVQIIDNFEGKDRNWEITMKKKIVEKILQNDNMFWVTLTFIRNCKTDTGKALCFWLQGQKNTTWKSETLIKALHLSSKRKADNLRKVRKAFIDNLQAGFLQEWKEEKRKDDIYFSFILSDTVTLSTK